MIASPLQPGVLSVGEARIGMCLLNRKEHTGRAVEPFDWNELYDRKLSTASFTSALSYLLAVNTWKWEHLVGLHHDVQSP